MDAEKVLEQIYKICLSPDDKTSNFGLDPSIAFAYAKKLGEIEAIVLGSISSESCEKIKKEVKNER
jgi:hypothetical protein